MRISFATMLGSIGAVTLTLSPVVAFSQEAPANQNVAAGSFQELTVQYIDAQDRTINDARFIAAAASTDKVAIVVWGGTRAIQQEAYNAALDLVDMGIPTAFVLAPDHNSLDGDAVMQVYAASTPRDDSRVGTNNADQVRLYMREAGIAAFQEAFPERFSALNISPN